MDRRTFNKIAGLGAIQSLSGHAIQAAQLPSSAVETYSDSKLHETAHIPVRAVEWPSRTYRRLLVDTHVPDWDDRLLASFDAGDYVSTIAGAGFQSLMQYANSHVGLCLWRTKIGQMHRNMRGRDYFGEVMEQCRRHGLHRVAYYSLVYDDWAYDQHPDWRVLSPDYSDADRHERTGAVCINSPYRDHVLACVKELVGGYDFESIFFDMTFWPTICYCRPLRRPLLERGEHRAVTRCRLEGCELAQIPEEPRALDARISHCAVSSDCEADASHPGVPSVRNFFRALAGGGFTRAKPGVRLRGRRFLWRRGTVFHRLQSLPESDA